MSQNADRKGAQELTNEFIDDEIQYSGIGSAGILFHQCGNAVTSVATMNIQKTGRCYITAECNTIRFHMADMLYLDIGIFDTN